MVDNADDEVAPTVAAVVLTLGVGFLVDVGVSTGAGAVGVPKAPGVAGVAEALSLAGVVVLVDPPKLKVLVLPPAAAAASFLSVVPPPKLKPPPPPIAAGAGADVASFLSVLVVLPPKVKPPRGAGAAAGSFLSVLAAKLNPPKAAGAGAASLFSVLPGAPAVPAKLKLPVVALEIAVVEGTEELPVGAPKLNPVVAGAGAGVDSDVPAVESLLSPEAAAPKPNPPLEAAGAAPKLKEGLSDGAGVDPKEKDGALLLLLFAFLDAPCSDSPKLNEGIAAVDVAGAAPKENAGLFASLVGALPNEKDPAAGAGAEALLDDPKLNAMLLLESTVCHQKKA